MNDSDIQTSQTPLHVFLTLLKNYKAKIAILVFLIMLIAISPSMNALILKQIIDTVSNYSGQELMPQMMIWIIVYASWVEFINITYRLYDFGYYKLMPHLKAGIVDYFFRYIQHQSHYFFQKEMAGNISNLIMDATKSLEYFISSLNEKIIKKFIGIIAALITISFVNTLFAKIFFLWLVLFCVISVLFAPKINYLSARLAAKKSNVAGRIIDAISNIVAIRMFSMQNYENKYLSRYLEKFVKSDVQMQWFLLKVRYLIGFIYSLTICAMLYYLAKLRSQNLLTIGDFVLILSICNDTADDIWELSEELGDTLEDYGAFKQACALLVPNSIQDEPNAQNMQVTNGEIEFRKVIFSYTNQDRLFNDKSIIIPGKHKIGLVGYSGSGKTSFVNLINRFYNLDSGAILIDGQDIAKVTQKSLRDNISFIPQEPILFHRSIMDNIRYGKFDATDEEVFEVAKKAHIHDAIINMPQGYNSLCGERGSSLSGGQRQRIIIARAILKNAPILILDEATSSLDSLTERQIQESLDFLMKDKTVLVIAHRLSTLLTMDKIMVFENGKIVESDTHDALLKKQGLYYRFWNSQNQFLIN